MNAIHSQPIAAEADPFDKAMRALEEWDRECRELHARHMAEIAKAREAMDEAIDAALGRDLTLVTQ